MNDLAKIIGFRFESFQSVRIIDRNNEPWFIEKDVCNILGIRNYRDVISDFPETEKGVVITDTLGGPQKMLIVNEAGLYRLIFKSRKPVAQRFQTWVFEEVLPSIRKYGFYRASLPKTWPYGGKNLTWGEYVAKKEEAFFKRHPDATFEEFLASLPNR